MIDFFVRLFDTSGFVPRRLCGNWTPELIFLHNFSDAAIWLAYLAVPLTLIYITRSRKDLPFKWMFWLFFAFILSCGFTHLLEVVIFYHPVYRLSGVMKLATAVASCATVLAFIPLMPRLLSLPSGEELKLAGDVKFRLLADSIPQLAWTARPDGHHFWYNKKWYDYTATTPAQMDGWGWQSVHDPAELPRVLERWKASISTGEPFDMVVPLRGGDGQFRSFLTRVMPVRDADGKIIQWFGTNTDVHEQKQNQEALQQEIAHRRAVEDQLHLAHAALENRVQERTAALEERTQALMQSETALKENSKLLTSVLTSIEEGVIVADVDGKFVYFNPAAEVICGLGATDASPEMWSERYGLCDPENGELIATDDVPLVRAIRGLKTSNMQIILRNAASGREKFVTITGTPLQAEDGLITGGVVVFRDNTTIKEAEAALRDSEERFRNAFEYAPSGMLVVALEGRLLKVNRAMCEIVGRTEEELLATTFQAITHPDDLAADLENATRLLAGEISDYQMEKRYIHKQGHEVWILLGASLVRGAKSEPLYFIAHVLDFTQRKAAENKIRESLEEKEFLLKEIHHRVKNNLQVVSSLLFLQSQHTQDEASIELFQECQHRVHSMALVHERLYRSKDLARVDFTDYIENLANYLFRSYQVDAERIGVEVDVQDVCPSIDVAVPCGLLLNELISNCLKHAFNGRERGRIRIELLPVGAGEVLLAVSDDGIGLPPSIDPSASETFGIQLVMALVEQLRGRITIQREAGTMFRIVFPLVK